MTEETKVKRFYKAAAAEAVEDQYVILLDGRAAKTIGRNQLRAPSKSLADAIAAEWDAQSEFIDRNTMPLTALLAGAIDQKASCAEDPVDEILSFLKTDLLCYRADKPAALQERQAAAWDPYLSWFDATFGARLGTTTGIAAVEQPGEALDAVREELAKAAPFTAPAVKIATEITGSAVLALGLWRGEFDQDAIFDASRVDEAFQEERWGVDAEAEARTKRLAADFAAVARFLSLV